jgi:hypothetical protein
MIDPKSTKVSTGIDGLDEIIDFLRIGDNVVWQVDKIEDYREFVEPYLRRSLADNRNVVYFRFAHHESLIDNIENKDKITVYNIDAYNGFEQFSTQINKAATKEGREAFYLFDCLSDLLYAWATDFMIGNFFMITCPYLYELDTIAFFAILRNRCSFRSIAQIRETTQLFMNLYKRKGKVFVHPLKVYNRYTSTMFLPHIKDGDEFIPITNSVDTARFFTEYAQEGLGKAERNIDYWDRMFIKAADFERRAGKGEKGAEIEGYKMLDKICTMLIGKDKRAIELAKQYFTLADLIDIKSRLIGSGYIGGKAVGMLLARKIIALNKNHDLVNKMEMHDSFYIGSDVFFSYIVHNKLWKLWLKQKESDEKIKIGKEIRKKIHEGKFPESIRELLYRMLDHYGQAPIIIRSSSLLEDSFGNAFAGKYESVFCINQGSFEDRYEKLEEAIKIVYGSTMSPDAIGYRIKRGMSDKEEQMGILVQRVSGGYHGEYFYPTIGGVGISYNTYVWEANMKPESGMLRLVYGLGTRAVDRIEGDYARIVALDKPLLKSISTNSDLKEFSQHEVDVLDVRENIIKTVSLRGIGHQDENSQLENISIRDFELEKRLRDVKQYKGNEWTVTFDPFFKSTDYIETMKEILMNLESSYSYPVDIEFTVNFDHKGEYKINLLQCRPLQVNELGGEAKMPENIDDNKLFLKSSGNFMGGNVLNEINYIIYVSPVLYKELVLTDKHEVARTIGRLNRLLKKDEKDNKNIFLIGPGRWGTGTPSLGVPVNFSEINNMDFLGEISDPVAGFSPDLSFGTHFFQDLVESSVFYIGIFPQNENVEFNINMLDSYNDIFADLLPENQNMKDIIKVYNLKDSKMYIASDVKNQKLVCYCP